jgi:hypothetical protein
MYLQNLFCHYLKRERFKKISEVDVYISIPDTPEEFKNIFNSLNKSQLDECKKIREGITNEKNKRIHFLKNSDFLTKEIINHPQNTPLIIIGHNVNGNFHLPDGSVEHFYKIDSLANLSKQTIIYLSCNARIFTSDPAANYYLKYSDGIALANRINDTLIKSIGLNNGYEQTKEMLNNIILAFGKE